ncbi:Senescence/spartin-associated [Kalmanozyma brasiliensis GHG001]|uniref:Senescence domain-containing protein n=1 Tax=Kalmanozyma brasiliensis (strain GHG001) TaxID=1365824 RepID=V5EWC2_KALBG|nr:Senescence/spartin-associated [Kalmanozyma brasiliensis GHG001]EST06579.1 Senescence/spartin-associated [Kalmanozyma brasiliensis GHG001]
MSSINSDQSSKGVELLSIPGAIATQEYHGDTVILASGKLQALLVTIEMRDSAHQSHTTTNKEKEADHSTDLWLVLSIGDDFSLPVAANQRIIPEGDTYKRSYLFPSVELEGASIKVSLPATTNVNTITRFQQILSQYAAFEDDDRSDAGTMELMDEDGQVLGVVQGFTVRESDAVSDSGNEKDPVLIDLPPESVNEGEEKQDLQVDVLSPEERRDWMIKGADTISRTIVKSADFVGGKIQGAANSYMSKTPAAGSPGTTTPNNEKTEAGRDPLKFGPKTHASAQQLNDWSGQAVQMSAKTTGAILQMAGNIGDKIGRKTGIQRKTNPDGSSGPAPKGIRGFVNRGLIAANTVLDGIDAGAQTLLYTSGQAASDVVGHRYGDDAREVANAFGRTGKNVFIVYKDVRGIRRSALLKAARGRVMKAKLQDGREVTIKVDEKGQAVASSVSGSATGTSTAQTSSATSEKSSYVSASENQDPPAY